MSKMTQATYVEKFGAKDIICLLIIALIIVPIMSPLGIPLSISPRTLEAYNYIENINKPECHAYIEVFYDLASRVELESGLAAITKHLFSKGCKIVFGTIYAPAVVVFPIFMSASEDIFAGKEYGKDYVYLGFIGGTEAALASIARSIKGTLSTDNYGNKLEDLPLLREVDGAKDFDIVVVVSAGADTFAYYVRQWYTPYNTPLIFVPQAIIAPMVEPYVSAKQAEAMVTGLRGGAEYELLVKRPKLGIAAMDAMSLTHMLIMLFIVGSNISYWSRRLSSKRGESR
ncbi:MAG: hypothetical protein QXS05_09685 [Candidatus Bathyarchaeia archaeon]